MKKVILHINSDGETQDIQVDGELSVGRTNQANVSLPDNGLSRVNTTFFRDGESIFAVDENSTNGTFINGGQIFSSPRKLEDGDRITIGTNTQITVKILETKTVSDPVSAPSPASPNTRKPKKQKANKPEPQSKPIPLIPIIAGVSFIGIILFAVGAIILVNLLKKDSGKKITPTNVSSAALIPKRVIDPLGGEDPEDIDDLIAAWEAEDVPTEAKDLEEVKAVSDSSNPEAKELNVSVAFWQQMRDLAMGPRSAPTGINPPGMVKRPELCCGVPKQVKKLSQMLKEGYTQPLDYADLAQKRMSGDLIELPLATKYYFVDVGGNANNSEFTQYTWETGSTTLPSNAVKYQILQKLAGNFAGQKYDLNNPDDRKQIKKRLLRMFNKKAKPILEELAMAYFQKFNRPLRVTSLTRSIEYQISLNSNNANSFKVTGKGSLPPHTSGCAFDLSRKQMTAEEQNFVINKLAEMENLGKLDAIIEGNANACFHVFIYPDGKPPF